MHHRVNVVLGKKALQQGCVSGVTEHKITAGNRGLETGAEVVQGDYGLARLTELADHVAANVTGTAGNEYLFVLHIFFRITATNVNQMLLREGDSINTVLRNRTCVAVNYRSA
jgi:hypothetical protein